MRTPWRRCSGRFWKTSQAGRAEGVAVDLRGKTAVATGGASGIGRALLLRFAREAANVVVADLDERGMAAVAAEAQALRVKARAPRTHLTGLTQAQGLPAHAF